MELHGRQENEIPQQEMNVENQEDEQEENEEEEEEDDVSSQPTFYIFWTLTLITI
jgi:hypothetical protein